MGVMSAARLEDALKTAGIPVISVRVGVEGQSVTVTVLPEGLQVAAQATINAFDWSQAAEDQWLLDRNPERRDLLAEATQTVQDNQAYLALVTPTNAQSTAQIKALTRQMNRVIRRLVQIS